MSLATIYNTLHAFADAGLLRAIEGAGDRTVFDTNTRQHHHFHLEGSDEVIDIPDGAMCFARTPAAPDGMVIVDVQVIVRLKRQDPAQH
jgi:Fur family iron response transcriptional regulator